MSEADQVAETGAATETPADQQAPQADEFETAARAGGWVPKDEFEGPPDKWKDAKSYVLHAAEILPSLTKDLRSAKDEIKDVKKTLREFGDYHSKTAQREYERAVKDIEARLNEAHASGDAQGVMDAAEDLAELKAEEKTARKAPAQSRAPELEAFIEENPWYGKDKPLTAACNAIAEEVFNEGYTGKAQVAEVTRRLKEEFPHKFAKAENPNRRLPGAVEGNGTATRKAGKTFADLPPEAKKMCDEFVRDIKGFTREQFVKDYDWS